MLIKKTNYLIEKTLTVATLFSFIFFIGALTSNAQQMQQQQQIKTDYSDEELEQFVETYLEAMPLYEESEEKMIEEIEDQGLTVEQFNDILAQLENPQVEVTATEEEIEAFEKAMEEVQEIQMTYNLKINSVIEDNDMTNEEYEMIIMAYQQDRELQQRIDELIQEMAEEPPF